MEKFELVKKAFEVEVNKSKTAYRDRIKKLENAWSEANSMLPPTMDVYGRFHAPADGYSLCEKFDFVDGVDPQRLYRKGEFLPVPLSNDEYEADRQMRASNRRIEQYAAREKLKIDLSLAEEICTEFAENQFIQFSHGKSWAVNGIEVCYLYLKSEFEHTVLRKFFAAIKDAVENTDKHIYTGAAVEGRQRVKGRIISRREEPVSIPVYPYEDVICKAFIVLDNDSTCMGNIPFHFEVGDEIEFTASFTKSNHDHHSFFKRQFKMVLTNPKTEE